VSLVSEYWPSTPDSPGLWSLLGRVIYRFAGTSKRMRTSHKRSESWLLVHWYAVLNMSTLSWAMVLSRPSHLENSPALLRVHYMPFSRTPVASWSPVLRSGSSSSEKSLEFFQCPGRIKWSLIRSIFVVNFFQTVDSYLNGSSITTRQMLYLLEHTVLPY